MTAYATQCMPQLMHMPHNFAQDILAAVAAAIYVAAACKYLAGHLTICDDLQADCVEGRLLINPGSATGAFNSLHEDVVPSFVLMDISGKKVRVRVTCIERL